MARQVYQKQDRGDETKPSRPPPLPGYTEPLPLFSITYRHSHGRAAGVVVIQSRDLLHARFKASLASADRAFEFVSGHQLDPGQRGDDPTNMIGRFLDDRNLRKLRGRLIKKKPPAPSMRR
jgi:hypothetical protein